VKCPSCEEDMVETEEGTSWRCGLCGYHWPPQRSDTKTKTKPTVVVGQAWRFNDPRRGDIVRVAAVAGDEVIVARLQSGRHSRLKHSAFYDEGRQGLTLVASHYSSLLNGELDEFDQRSHTKSPCGSR
jgi:hypothetical protein